MRVMAVDDEALALKRLERLIGEVGIEAIDTFNDPLQALQSATKNRYDVVFLDISMPNMSGLELANKIIELEPSTFIIFQSAYDEYALEAFASGGIGYLLKPIERNDIQKALEKVAAFQNTHQSTTKRLLGKRYNKLYLIDIEDIFYIKADLDEVIVRIKEADVYVKKKIGELDSLLKNSTFYRVHRSYIVNVDKIKSMESVEQSKLQISFNGIDDTVTSSKEGAKEFREYLERSSL
ncbi:MAG: response regulator transcription factor [Campylobacterales bacterium]|nr:response regulator transcription factor [Campylobacterales bacterium]